MFLGVFLWWEVGGLYFCDDIVEGEGVGERDRGRPAKEAGVAVQSSALPIGPRLGQLHVLS